MKLITERLTECREKIGISKQEAARRVGVSQPAYLRYESGARNPSQQVIKEIAKVFNTSVDYLTGNCEEPTSDFVEIKRSDDEELFLLVEQYRDLDSQQKKRLLAYLDKLTK